MQLKNNDEQDTLRIITVKNHSRFSAFCYGVGRLLIIQSLISLIGVCWFWSDIAFIAFSSVF